VQDNGAEVFENVADIASMDHRPRDISKPEIWGWALFYANARRYQRMNALKRREIGDICPVHFSVFLK